jgi:hypothetical protein
VKRTATSAAFRKLLARLGAFAQQAQYDTRETTKAARAAFNARFANEVDPQRILSETERARRAEAARRAYFTAWRSNAAKNAQQTT